MAQRALSNQDIKDMRQKPKSKKKWDGVERRKSINSYVEPYFERRREGSNK